MATPRPRSRSLLLIAGALLAGLIVLTVVVGFFLGTAVKSGINSFAPAVTGTTVTLESARLSPFTGSGTLTELVIGNPPGWSDAPLARLGRVHLDVKPTSLLGDTLVIRDLVVESPEFRYETKIISSNVRELLQHIESVLGGDGEQPVAAADTRKFAVQRFILRDGRVTLGGGGATVTVPLPDLELNDLGTPEQGLTAVQLTAAISRAIVADIVTAAARALTTTGSTTGAATIEGARKLGESLKGLFGGDKAEEKPAAPTP